MGAGCSKSIELPLRRTLQRPVILLGKTAANRYF